MSIYADLSGVWRYEKILVFLLCLSKSISSQGSVGMADADDMNSHGVIFSQVSAAKIAKRYPFLGLSSPYWKPKASDVEKIKQGLSVYLNNNGGVRGKRIADELGSYKLQYLGYTEAGDQWVVVNGICENYWSRDNLWRSELTVVFDGGACFFQTRYSMKTKQFYRLELGGES